MRRLILILLFTILSFLLFAQIPEWQWAISAGGSYMDCGIGLAIDENGNNYISGLFRETVTFDSYSVSSNGLDDIIVAKIDANGNCLWVSQAGSIDNDIATEIVIDNYGNCYVTGRFEEEAYFGNLSINSNGGEDIFVAKLDNDGNWLWATKAGGSSYDVGFGITIDDDSNCYVTGHFWNTATFGAYTVSSNGNDDIFVAKIDTNGTWLWVNNVGDYADDRGYAIISDDSNNCYVTGYFRGTASFGTYSLTSNGWDDIFVAKLDTNGIWLWAANAGGIYDDQGRGISVDSNNKCYITGRFKDTATFGQQSHTSNGDFDIFVSSLDENGQWIWSTNAGGSDEDLGLSIVTDYDDNIYLSGAFQSSSTFGSYSLISNGNLDIFIAKIIGLGEWFGVTQVGGSGDDLSYGIKADSNGNNVLVGAFGDPINFGSYSLSNNGTQDIFVAKLGNDTSIENESIPTITELANYPNPFNPSTTINFSIQNNSKIELSIFNIKGQMIKTLANNEFTKGNHSIIWNGNDETAKTVSSGIYYYQLNVNGKIEAVKKCLLLK